MYTFWPDYIPGLQNNLHIVNSIPPCRWFTISSNSSNLKLNAWSLPSNPGHLKGDKLVHLSCLTVYPISVNFIHLFTCINQQSGYCSWDFPFPSPHTANLYQQLLWILLLLIPFIPSHLSTASPNTVQAPHHHLFTVLMSPGHCGFPVLIEKGHVLSPVSISSMASCCNPPCFLCPTAQIGFSQTDHTFADHMEFGTSCCLLRCSLLIPLTSSLYSWFRFQPKCPFLKWGFPDSCPPPTNTSD